MRRDREKLVAKAQRLVSLCEPDALFFRIATRREVARDFREAEERAAVVDRREHDVRPEHRAVFAHAPCLFFESTGVTRNLDLACRLSRLPIGLLMESIDALADDFVRFVAEDSFRTEVPARHSSGGVEHEDRVVLHAVDEQSELHELALVRTKLLVRSLQILPSPDQIDTGTARCARGRARREIGHVDDRMHDVEETPAFAEHRAAHRAPVALFERPIGTSNVEPLHGHRVGDSVANDAIE